MPTENIECTKCGKLIYSVEPEEICDSCWDEIYRDELIESNYEEERLKE